MTDKAFIKGLRVLTALADNAQPWALKDLAAELGLTKSNTHRLLNTLVDEGFARQLADKGHYAPTLKLWELGTRIMARVDVASVAHDYLTKFGAAIGEQVHLSALDGRETVYLFKVDCNHTVRLSTQLGSRAPAWCTAGGRILLAHMNDARFSALRAEMLAAGDCTEDNIDALQATFPQLRQSQVAYNLGSWRKEAVAVATCVFDASGTAIASIAIAGPASRVSEDFLRKHSGELIGLSQQISRELGYLPKYPIGPA